MESTANRELTVLKQCSKRPSNGLGTVKPGCRRLPFPLVALALNTGARQGELLQLRYEDVDLDRALIYFGRTKNRKLKTVPLNRTAREAVEWL